MPMVSISHETHVGRLYAVDYVLDDTANKHHSAGFSVPAPLFTVLGVSRHLACRLYPPRIVVIDVCGSRFSAVKTFLQPAKIN